MKNGASLLKNLTRFDRHSKMCLEQIDTESGETLKSGDMENLTRTSRQIARVQLNMMKLARAGSSVQPDQGGSAWRNALRGDADADARQRRHALREWLQPKRKPPRPTLRIRGS